MKFLTRLFATLAEAFFFPRQKYSKSRSLAEVTLDWKKLEAVWEIRDHFESGTVAAPEGFGYFLAGQSFQSTEPETPGCVPFSVDTANDTEEAIEPDCLLETFLKAA